MSATAGDPWEPGRVLEASFAADHRKARGAWYTPPALAVQVAGWGLEACDLDLPVVCDPACGGGAFLLAAAEHLAGRGHDRAAIVQHLAAMDLEPQAVRATAAALERWCDGAASPMTAVGDALLEPWPARPDVVVGNPPFLGQLAASTARSPDRSSQLRARWGAGASGYVDESALFLLAASRSVAPGGSVALLQPESLLATRSAAPIRTELAPWVRRIELHGDAWFETAVRVCTVVVVPGHGDTSAASVGVPPIVEGDRWSPLLASARGVPAVTLSGDSCLGEVADLWAGFRDEYYGLVDLVSERGDTPVLTGGLIDPARSRWGQAPARFGRRSWTTPSVRRARLPAWASAMLRPKLLVATQTRVIEAVADEAGAWVPVTPVVAVLPTGEGPGLRHLLAALLAPPASAWAMAATAGSALSAEALKVSAGLLRTLPLPQPGAAWDDAAELVGRAGDTPEPAGRASLLVEAGAAMCDAYGVTRQPVLDWWSARLPHR